MFCIYEEGVHLAHPQQQLLRFLNKSTSFRMHCCFRGQCGYLAMDSCAISSCRQRCAITAVLLVLLCTDALVVGPVLVLAVISIARTLE